MNTRTRTATAALAAVALLGGLTGCNGEGAATPPPSSSATVSVAPTTAAPSPTPSAPTYADAEKVYRAAMTLKIELAQAGGIATGKPAPAELTNLAADQALSDILSTLNQVADRGIKSKGTYQIVAVAQDKTTPMTGGSVLALKACVDGSKLNNTHPDGTVTHGQLVLNVATFKVVDGTLKMNTHNGDKVATCPIA